MLQKTLLFFLICKAIISDFLEKQLIEDTYLGVSYIEFEKLDGAVEGMFDTLMKPQLPDIEQLVDALSGLSAEQLRTLPPPMYEMCIKMMESGLFPNELEDKFSEAFGE